MTLILDGWHGDSSRMFPIGEIPRRAERLIEVTHEAMMRGIAVIRPGATTGDIGHAIQTFVEAQHMSEVARPTTANTRSAVAPRRLAIVARKSVIDRLSMPLNRE